MARTALMTILPVPSGAMFTFSAIISAVAAADFITSAHGHDDSDRVPPYRHIDLETDLDIGIGATV